MDANHKRLLDRAMRTFGNIAPADAIAKTRAIVGPGVIPKSEEKAQQAMEKLKSGKIPTTEELIALEFVIRIMRPAPLSHQGLLDSLDEGGGDVHPPATVDRWNDFRAAVVPLLSSIGRIDHPNRGHIGTGFMVKPDLLATNRHVLDQLSGGAGVLPDAGAQVRFNVEEQANEPASTKGRLLQVKAVHPTLDIALFEIKMEEDRSPLSFDLETVVEDGHPIVVVGFPAESSGSNPLFADAIFRGLYGVKRGSLGEVMEPAAPVLYHDCTTLRGNSGSPVFSLLSHKVIGIHRSGMFTYRNEGLFAREIRAILAN